MAPLSPEQLDEKSRGKFWQRVVGSAMFQSAERQRIIEYLTSCNVPNPEVVVTRVEKVALRERVPQLTALEMFKLGGVDEFRALFGLPETDKTNPRPARDYPYTESGDAEFFANKYADILRFDHIREIWLLRDQAGIWNPDSVNHVVTLARKSIRCRQEIAQAINHESERKEAKAWVEKGENLVRLMHTLELAKSICPIADDGKHWDEDPFLIGCQNGILDLRTGQVRPVDSIDADPKVSKRVLVRYNPDADCPKWKASLATIFASDDPEESQRVIDFMQRSLGYSITGDCREECCFFTWGEGSNGKGLSMNTIGWLLGEYYDDMPYSTLERTAKGGGIPNDVAKLKGRRFVTCSEVNEFTLNESRLKALTGRDPMTARFLNKEFFTFIPVCKIWIATNNKPKISGQDDGIWRRIHLIPFLNKFDKQTGNINTKLKDELRDMAELEGIFKWLVDGARAWYERTQQGLDALEPPNTVRIATQKYRQESNLLMPFVESRLQLQDGRTQASVLRQEYERFCEATSAEKLSTVVFGSLMKLLFKTTVDRDKRTIYHGVVLRSERQEPAGQGAGGPSSGVGTGLLGQL